MSGRFYTVSLCSICIVQVNIFWLQRNVEQLFIQNVSSSGPQGIPVPSPGFLMKFPCLYNPPQLWPRKDSRENGHQHLRIRVITFTNSSTIPSAGGHYHNLQKLDKFSQQSSQSNPKGQSPGIFCGDRKQISFLNLKG